MKTIKISIQTRIKIYQEALELLEENYKIGKQFGWCFALTNSNTYIEHKIPCAYTPRNMKKYFPDLLKYSKIAKMPGYVEEKLQSYLFPLNEEGHKHRVTVLKYRIKQLKEELNK